MEKDKLIEIIKEIAFNAWTGAANSYRMYPENKHTFSNHWELNKTKYKEYEAILTSLTAPVPDGKLPELEIEEWAIDTDPEGTEKVEGWTAGLKGTPIMATAITKEKAIDELMTSIRVALLHEYNSKLTKTPDAG